MRKPQLSALLGVVSVVLGARSALGDTCPAAAPELRDVGVEARLRFLHDTFDREVWTVDLWSWSWGSVYAAAAVTQAAIIPTTSDRGLRTDLTVGAVSAGVGSLFLYGLPLSITLPLRSARQHWDQADRCELLLRAEAALESGARSQALSNGVVPHIGNVLVNAGIALILGLGYGRWKSAAISAGVGLVVGETNAFTQPHHLPRALDAYRRAQLQPEPLKVTWSVAPWMTSAGGGASLSLAF